MSHPFPEDRADAIRLAKEYVLSSCLFLDTETTGLSEHHEVCDIAIVDVTGSVLLETLVKPVKQPIERGATEIHGITMEMCENAPTMQDLLPEMERLLRGKTVLVYNMEFDQGKLYRSMLNNGIHIYGDNTSGEPEGLCLWWMCCMDGFDPDPKWHCAMDLYARYYGAFNEYHGSYRWQRLSTALEQCGLELPKEDIHRARPDAEMTRRLLLHMANQPLDEQMTLFGEESHDHE